MNPSGEDIQVPFETAATQARLSMYVSQIPAFANRIVALHGLRSGCAISLAIAGTKLGAIMDHVGGSPRPLLDPGGAADALS